MATIPVVASAEKLAYIEQRERTLDELLEMIHDVDLILVEGYKNCNLPQIGIARTQNKKGFAHELSRYIAIVSDTSTQTQIPHFALNDAEGVADFIEKTFLRAEG